MAAGDLITTDYRVEYNGVVLGEDGIEIESVDGLDALPDLRVFDKDRPLRHGQFAGTDLASKRAITITGVVWATDATTFRERVTALGDALALGGELPLVIQLPGYPFTQARINCRARNWALPAPHSYVSGPDSTYSILFEATDPRIYDNTETQASTAAAVTGGGLSFPLTFPLDFGGTGTTGIVDLTNTGNFATPWTAEITGTCTNPQLENVSTGQLLRFGISLGSTDTLHLGSDLRTVLLNPPPGASRKSTQSSDSAWWDLPPGTTNVRFTSATGTPSVTLSFRSARIS